MATAETTIGVKRSGDFDSDDDRPPKRIRLENKKDEDPDVAMASQESEEWDDEDGNWSDGGGDGDDWGDPSQMDHTQILQSGVVRTPTEISRQVKSNVAEVKLIPLFDAVCALKGTRIDIALGIRVREIPSITEEQLEVWGLERAHDFIIIKITFGAFYLNENETPTVEVGAAYELSTDAELKSFRLSWTIKERCQNSLLSIADWPPPQKERANECPDPEALSDLMEGAQQEYAVCLAALHQSHNDQASALTLLMDPSQLSRIKRGLPTAEECDEELSGIFARVSEEKAVEQGPDFSSFQDNADLDTQAQSLSEMFDIPFNAAKMVAGESRTYDEAVEKLNDPSYKENVITAFVMDASQHDLGGAPPAPSSSSSSSSRKRKKKKKRKRGDSPQEPETSSSDIAAAATASNVSSPGTWRDRVSKFTGLFRRSSSSNGRDMIPADVMSRTLAVMCRHNFLVKTLCFDLKTLLNGNKRCLICDVRMPYVGLKPGVCSNPMCVFQHQEMGLGFSLANEILKRPEITDILMSMLVAGCYANRVEIFFPEGVRGDGEFSDQSFLNEMGKPDVGKLSAVIEACPPVGEMVEWAAAGQVVLKQRLNECHPLLYGLLCWVITSNRTHLRTLKDEEQITELRSCRAQFALASATPEREQIFQDLKRRYGSIMTFHGSPFGNWHSILRMGLKNYSGSKYQMHGAAHGNGIYLAVNANTSVSYSKPGQSRGWNKSQWGQSINCMAVCEVIKAPSLKEKSAFGGIYVVPNEEHVVTRFFVLFDSGTGLNSVTSKNLTIPEVVRSQD